LIGFKMRQEISENINSNNFPVLVRGTNLNEVLYIFEKKNFPYFQNLIHAYTVKEGFLENSIFTNIPINPKNSFNYVRNSALPWAALLYRNERYIKGRDSKLFSKDSSGGYLIYFNKKALDFVVCQDRFDVPEVLSAVILNLKETRGDCVQEVVPLLPNGLNMLNGYHIDRVGSPLFESEDVLHEFLFEEMCSKNPFSF